MSSTAPGADMTPLVTALSFHQAGRAAEAAELYKQVIAAEPENADAHYLLGILARQARQPETAVKLIRQAIALKPDAAQFHYHLGMAYRDLGDAGEAKRSLMRALQLQSRYIDALSNLADLLLSTGKDVDAATCYQAVLRLDPKHAETLRRLGFSGADPRQA
jgi:tetratricopeptide (TPR) repeat protein